MNETTILFATSDRNERREFERMRGEKGLPFRIILPDEFFDAGAYLVRQGVDVVVADLSFQNGAFAEWLSLWPVPLVLLVDDDQTDRVATMVLDESSSFLMRQAGYAHLAVLPVMIRKVLNSRESIARQNRHLQLSERLYHDLVEAIPDIVYMIDAQGRFTYINNAVLGLGWQPAELVGRHFSQILALDESAKVARKSVLPGYYGKVTGSEGSPRLFDERRSVSRRTQGLEVRLRKREQAADAAAPTGSVTSFGEDCSVELPSRMGEKDELGSVGIIRDITDRKLAAFEQERLVGELRRALAEVRTLSGFIPICAGCKKIRDDKGYWSQVEEYISKHSSASFSHGLCPDCLKKFDPDIREQERPDF